MSLHRDGALADKLAHWAASGGAMNHALATASADARMEPTLHPGATNLPPCSAYCVIDDAMERHANPGPTFNCRLSILFCLDDDAMASSLGVTPADSGQRPSNPICPSPEHNQMLERSSANGPTAHACGPRQTVLICLAQGSDDDLEAASMLAPHSIAMTCNCRTVFAGTCMDDLEHAQEASATTR